MGYYRVALKRRIEEKRQLAARIVEFIRQEMKHINLSSLGRELEISNLQPIVKGDRTLPYRQADRVAAYLAEHYSFPYISRIELDVTKLKVEISNQKQSVKISGIGFQYSREGARVSLRSTSGQDFDDTERSAKLHKLAAIDKLATQI